jgi:hypothetical protein
MFDQQLSRGGNQRLAEVSMVEPLFGTNSGSIVCLGHTFFPWVIGVASQQVSASNLGSRHQLFVPRRGFDLAKLAILT